MEISQLKNMVVLKNLPSNMVEEAIVVLTENQKIKAKEYTKNKQNEKKEKLLVTDSDDYIVNEAKIVISNCIDHLERKEEKANTVIQKKYKKTQYANYGLMAICLLQLILWLIK